MIIGVGMDIVEIERVVKACEKPAFMQKYFTEEERALVEQKRNRAATNFAAKEAVSKVFGTGFRGFAMHEIEVLRDKWGKPYVKLHGRAAQTAQNLGIRHIHISLSDSKSYATAFAIGEGEVSCTF